MADKGHISGTTETPDVAELTGCVCNAYIGAIFVGTTDRIFVRIDNTIPCDNGDWVELTNIGGGYTFTFIDDVAASKIVNDGDTLTFNGLNGNTVTITGGNTININGHYYTSTSNPSGTPIEPTQVSFHLNTATNAVYIWNPSSTAWILVSKAETVTTLVNNGGGSYTYTSENGTQTTFTYAQTTTTLVNNNNGTFTYTNELGNTSTINILTLIDTYADVAKTIVLNGTVLELYDGASDLISSVDIVSLIDISADANNLISLHGDGLYASETVTTLVDNLDGTFTYTSEDGTEVIIDGVAETITTFVDNLDNTFTYTSEDGTETTIDISGSALTINGASTIGAGRLVTTLSITTGALLLNSAFEYLSDTVTETNSVETIIPIVDTATLASITMNVTNPSSDRSAKAYINFTGYPIKINTVTANNSIITIEEVLEIGGSTPADFTNQPSVFTLIDNTILTFTTQGYVGIVDLTPGQTVQVTAVVNLTVS